MDTEQARQFVTAAESATFREAAALCHVSQSTLTRSVQRIESELGVELFRRSGRRVSLSDAGTAALPHARRLVDEADLMKAKARAAQNRTRSLSIAACAPAPLWQLVPALSSEDPSLSISTQAGLPVSDLEGGLPSRDFDLVILPRPPEPRDASSIALMTETLSVCLPHDHPLANKPQVSFADLDGEKFLIQTNVGYWEGLIRALLPHSSFVSSGDYVLTANLMGVSPLAHFTTNYSLDVVRNSPGHVLVPISDAESVLEYHLAFLDERAGELSRWIELARALSRTLIG